MTANFAVEPTGWWHAYWVGEEIGSGVEIFSRGCITNLDSKAFVSRHYPKSHRQPDNKSFKPQPLCGSA